ncbi:hypothetical protein DFJ73DRAFT_830392 [Zopfochytrium polystomum]|nr:hypothetical protein DFJ73DRAFT_830392 [Zopfochytrium polystomum]
MSSGMPRGALSAPQPPTTARSSQPSSSAARSSIARKTSVPTASTPAAPAARVPPSPGAKASSSSLSSSANKQTLPKTTAVNDKTSDLPTVRSNPGPSHVVPTRKVSGGSLVNSGGTGSPVRKSSSSSAIGSAPPPSKRTTSVSSSPLSSRGGLTATTGTGKPARSSFSSSSTSRLPSSKSAPPTSVNLSPKRIDDTSAVLNRQSVHGSSQKDSLIAELNAKIAELTAAAIIDKQSLEVQLKAIVEDKDQTIESLRGHIESQVIGLHAEVAKSQAVLADTLSGHNLEKEALISTIRIHEESQTKMTADLASAKAEIATLTQALKAQEANLDVESNVREMDKLRRRTEEAQDEAAAAARSRDEALQCSEELRGNLQGLEIRVADLTSEVESLRTESAERAEHSVSLESELSSTLVELDSIREEKRSLTVSVEELKEALAASQSEIEGLRASLVTVQNLLSEKSKKLEELEARVDYPVVSETTSGQCNQIQAEAVVSNVEE